MKSQSILGTAILTQDKAQGRAQKKDKALEWVLKNMQESSTLVYCKLDSKHPPGCSSSRNQLLQMNY